jgi:hypothetical protein
MAQAVNRWSLTAEAWVRARFIPCGICGGQSGTGTGVSPSSSFSLVSIISPVLRTPMYLGNGPLKAAVQTLSLTPSTRQRTVT